MDKVYQVFVSSTFVDLKDERRLVSETLAKAGYMPAGMEFFPATDEQQLRYIKRVIDRSDYYVVIVKGRYGSLVDDKISFTEKEYEYALRRKIPVLAFLFTDPDKIELGKTDKNASQAKKLKSFRKRLSEKVRMIDQWSDGQDLCTKVIVALGRQANLTPGVGWVRGDQAVDPKIFQEIEAIRFENSDLKKRLQQMGTGVDRPVIYGGFGHRELLVSESSPSQIRASVTMANYGNAPGFISYIELGVGEVNGLPLIPEYSTKVNILDLFPPNMTMTDARLTRAHIDAASDGRQAVFQRVWYNDMSGKTHFSGSIYRLEVIQHGGKTFIVDEPVLPGTAYWDMD